MAIKKVYKLADKMKKHLAEEGKLFLKAKANKDKKIIIKRKGEDDVETTEAVLWEEVRVAGMECESAKLLKKKYPGVFIAAKKREDANNELQAYIAKEFGFDFTQMTITDYMKLTEAVIDYKLKEHDKK